MIWPFRRGDDTRRRYNEYQASGAAVFTTTYGSPDRESILPTFVSYAQQAYAGNAIIFAAILSRISLFSEVEFQFQALQDKRLFGNSDLALLEAPWPNGTTGELLARMEQDASLAGNAYIRNVDGERLERLRPDRVTIISRLIPDSLGRPYREVIGFAYDRTGMGSPIELYDVSEVAHWNPFPDPCAEFRGMSWLTPVVREIQADHGMTDHKIEYLNHAATPSVMIKYDKQLKPDTITAIEDRVDAKHGGPANAGRTVVVDAGADFEVVGNSLEAMNFSTVQEAGENRILMASGVPSIVAGAAAGLDAATYSNYGLAMRKFADMWARPQWRSACAALAPLVTVPPAARLWFDTRGIAALQAGEQERAEVFKAKVETAATALAAGYTSDSVATAVNAGDISLLVHTGLTPTSVYQQPPNGNGKTPALQGAN